MHVYSWNKRFVSEIATIEELFFEKIYPPFENVEEEATTAQNEAWDSFMSQPCPSEEYYVDPADFVDECFEIGYERYEVLSIMRYRTIAMWISCLCQVWEQQLIRLIVYISRERGEKYTFEEIKKLNPLLQNVAKSICLSCVNAVKISISQ